VPTRECETQTPEAWLPVEPPAPEPPAEPHAAEPPASAPPAPEPLAPAQPAPEPLAEPPAPAPELVHPLNADDVTLRDALAHQAFGAEHASKIFEFANGDRGAVDVPGLDRESRRALEHWGDASRLRPVPSRLHGRGFTTTLREVQGKGTVVQITRLQPLESEAPPPPAPASAVPPPPAPALAPSPAPAAPPVPRVSDAAPLEDPDDPDNWKCSCTKWNPPTDDDCDYCGQPRPS
jgi:hypothetical protein